MLRRTEEKVLWGLVLAICVIAGIGAIFYSNTAALIRDAERLDQTNAVINTLAQLYINVQDLTLATRGYVANYDERFLDRYNAAEARARNNLEVLHALAPAPSAEESQSLRELEELFESRRR